MVQKGTAPRAFKVATMAPSSASGLSAVIYHGSRPDKIVNIISTQNKILADEATEARKIVGLKTGERCLLLLLYIRYTYYVPPVLAEEFVKWQMRKPFLTGYPSSLTPSLMLTGIPCSGPLSSSSGSESLSSAQSPASRMKSQTQFVSEVASKARALSERKIYKNELPIIDGDISILIELK